MELFLIRHAIAAPRSLTLPDAERPLTRQGRERFAQAVVGMQHLGIRLRQVHHSPWLRAVETAALLAPVLQGDLLPTQALARPPETDLLHEIDQTPAALVGHEPWIERIAGLAHHRLTRVRRHVRLQEGRGRVVGRPIAPRRHGSARLPAAQGAASFGRWGRLIIRSSP